MQKRSLYSLLLTSFILVLAFSSLSAQTVLIESMAVKRVDAQTLDITVDNPDAISAFEIVLGVSEVSATGAVFDAFGVTWDGSFAVLQHRIIDLSGFTVGALPGTVRLAGMMLDIDDACLAPVVPGGTTVAQVNFTSNNVCDGEILMDGTTVTIDKCNCIITAETQFVDCVTTAIVGASVDPGTVTIANDPVVMDPIPDAVIDWDKSFTYQTVVTDDDVLAPAGVETHTYSVSSVPATIAPIGITGAGYISWNPLPADMVAACEYEVTVEVEDGCGVISTQVFMIYLWNDSPVITCPTEVNNIIWGYEASGSVSATDDDNGPVSLFYSVASFNGVGTVGINSSNGDWTWQTDETAPYLGVFDLCIKVTDGAAIGCDPLYTNPSNSDECCVQINVISTGDAMIAPEYTTRVPAALQGQSIWVDFNMTNSTLEYGGYDFLIQYDPTALIFQAAALGQWPTDCYWEYFTHRQGAAGNCGPNACPTGIVRVVAIAETNDGATPPGLCFSGTPPLGTWEMFKLKFLVTNDHTFECTRVPINWIWYDCGDNGMSSVTGDTLFMSRFIYNSYGNLVADADPVSPTFGLGIFTDYPANTISKSFPTTYGALDWCDDGYGDPPDPLKPFPLRLIDFWHGAIDIICVEDIDDRGDINMNGLANEIADAVLFTNYFIYGIGVFDVGANAPAGQVAATDVNADGITLSVADLVYLIRVIVGDAAPYVKSAPVNVSYTHAEGGIMSVDGAQIGAAFVVAEGNVMPDLKANAMEMRYNFDGANTRILVFSIEGNSFTGDFLDVKANVLSIEMATAEGNPVKESLRPNHFALNQNYPNPFNPTTTISFTLPTASDYMLTIYNVSGQTVAEFGGNEQAGEVVLEWEAGNLASGIYFYKLQAGNFTDTKKMVLLK